MDTTQPSQPTLAMLLDTMEQQTLNTRHHSEAERPDWQPLQDALRRLVGDASSCGEDPPAMQAMQAFGAACLDYVLTQKQEPHRLPAARENLAAAKQKVLEATASLSQKRA